MTLDEAIKHCKEKAEELRKDADYLDAPYGMDTSARTDCLECANEHEQLAEWLEDYKRLLGEKSYAMGYQDGLEDGLQGLRPEGEWVKVKEDRMSIAMSGELVTGYKCSNCGRMIATVPSKLANYPFCHCGAAMQKGDAE